MTSLSIKQKLSAFVSIWGPASISYGLLSGAQLLIGVSMQGSSAWLMIILAMLGLASVFTHKGKSFDAVRPQGGKPLLILPCSFKSTHVAVCGGMVLLCSSLPSGSLMTVPELAYPAAVLSVFGGWMATLAPGKENS